MTNHPTTPQIFTCRDYDGTKRKVFLHRGANDLSLLILGHDPVLLTHREARQLAAAIESLTDHNKTDSSVADDNLSRPRHPHKGSLLDLENAGLLPSGTKLMIINGGECLDLAEYNDGCIYVGRDGQAFESPSPASKHVSSSTLNGWTAWQVATDSHPYHKESLHCLRWRLAAQRFLAEADSPIMRLTVEAWLDYVCGKYPRNADPGKRKPYSDFLSRPEFQGLQEEATRCLNVWFNTHSKTNQ